MSVYEEMLAGVAVYLRAVPGIEQAFYPAPNSISGNNVAVVYAGDTHVTGGQEFLTTGRIRVQLYMAPTDTPTAVSRADVLIEKLCDQFAANNPGYHLDGQITSGAIDRCTVLDIQPSVVIGYAGHEYFGAVFYLDFKYRRFAGGGYAL